MRYLITIILLLVGLYVCVASYEGAKTLLEDSVKVAATTPKQYEYHGQIFKDEQELFAFVHQEQTSSSLCFSLFTRALSIRFL